MSFIPFTERKIDVDPESDLDPEPDLDPYSLKRIRGSGSGSTSKLYGFETLSLVLLCLLAMFFIV